MFRFFTPDKRRAVEALLKSCVNREMARQLQAGDRDSARCHLCEIAVLVRYTDGRRADFAAGRPSITREMSGSGFSVIDDRPMDDDTLLVGLRQDDGFRFLHCEVSHCTNLGYGHYQVGLKPTELVAVEGRDLIAFRTRLQALAEADTRPAADRVLV